MEIKQKEEAPSNAWKHMAALICNDCREIHNFEEAWKEELWSFLEFYEGLKDGIAVYF